MPIESKPEYSKRYDDTIWVQCVDPTTCEAHITPDEPVTETFTAPEIAYALSHAQNGSGILVPIVKTSTPSSQAQQIKIAAARAGFEVKITSYGQRSMLLVVKTSSEMRPKPEVMSAVKVFNWQRDQAINTDDGEYDAEPGELDLNPYLTRLLSEEEYFPGSGVLVPLTRQDVLYQQTRVHGAARKRNIKVRTSKWSSNRLLVQFGGYR